VRVVKNKVDLQHALAGQVGLRGFVPTMGALHEGHMSLVQKSISECDFTAVSIFVNPRQFDSKEDLQNYPRAIEDDLKALEQVGVDLCFLPESAEIYSSNDHFEIRETSGYSNKFCGADRPGHFEGVLTVVMKLLNLVGPDRMYMGEKDYQQLQLVKQMTAAFFMDVEVVGVPTARESSGLAMSSRNLRLSPEDQHKAAALFRGLSSCSTDDDAKAQLLNEGFEVDYIESYKGRRYGAVRIAGVRLIDNVEI
jgi:pantoate--beta-alanine ligase